MPMPAPLDLDGQRHRVGHAAQGEVAGDLVGLAVDLVYAGRNEGALGVILCVEEVGAEQVADQLLFGNGDGGDVDRTLDRDDSLVTDGDVALEAAEAAAEGGDAEVLHLEADLGVDGVDGVGAGLDAYCLFGGACFVSLRFNSQVD